MKLAYLFSSARLTARKKKCVKFLLEKEEEKVTPQHPPKKMKISAPEQVAQTSTKSADPVRKSAAKPSSKKDAKNEAPSQSTAALPKPIVKGRKTETDLGEFYKYKSDKGKVARRTNPQPFSFMLREEQKKMARVAKVQASKQNMVIDGEIVFNAKPVASTSTAAIDRLAQPKEKAPVEQEAKKDSDEWQKRDEQHERARQSFEQLRARLRENSPSQQTISLKRKKALINR